MTGRYAIYVAPERGSDLARFGDRWLGRDAESGAALEQPVLAGIEPARLQALTEAPRHYGFHGTLKPPFHLADATDSRALRVALTAFAKRQTGFTLHGLEIRAIGGFLALVPRDPAPDLSRLADACVTEFDSFRAPPEPAELARRHAVGLTARQAGLLARWGYPYVLDEFRFHLSLTGSIADGSERSRLADLLAPVVAPLLGQAVPVRELCLFHQPERAAPFRLADRFAFGR